MRAVPLRIAGLILLAITAGTTRAAAQASDTAASRVVAPGVVHRRIVDPAGPWVVNVLEVDLRRRELVVEGARALDALFGRETTSSLARRRHSSCPAILGAINGDFFDLRTGENENNQVISGELVKGIPVTQSPHDTFDNVHSQLALTIDGRPLIERFVFDGAWLTRWGPVSLGAVNSVPHSDGLVLFTRFFGATTPRDTSREMVVELALARTARRADTVTYAIRTPVRSGGGTPIPAHGAVLAGYGASARVVERIALDRRSLRLVLALSPDRGRLRTVVGGWPRVVRDGVNVAAEADSAEGTFPRFSSSRHPRTAVGFSRDSTTLLLVTVDGRHAGSAGMSLVELADLLLSLGAYQALNLDGGGSTTMVIEGRVVNTPSDSAGERTVGNALLVAKRPGGGCGR